MDARANRTLKVEVDGVTITFETPSHGAEQFQFAAPLKDGRAPGTYIDSAITAMRTFLGAWDQIEKDAISRTEGE